MKVIGAGLGRTGTMSLKFALEHIGFGPCYHMIEFMAHIPRDLPKWLDVVDGKPDWDSVFDGYAATVDYPGCTYWRELLARWPEAKVILTTRNPESWFESANETVLSPRMRAMLGQSPIRRFMEATVNTNFGDRIEDRAFMIDHFRRWNDDVIASVPADKLLVFQAADGWRPLCEFLGAPVPDEPYPRINSRADMNLRVAQGVQQLEDGPPSAEQMAAMGRARMEQMRAMAFPKS
jgi:hypothetical protein